MHTKGGSPVAFVEYQDVRFAAQAMNTLQGSFLLSSDRGAIRIEYAKSKMAEVGLSLRNSCPTARENIKIFDRVNRLEFGRVARPIASFYVRHFHANGPGPKGEENGQS
ncbi:unnamed protein product [Timema podura]|uniref:RRM domain-containing protein n=1 Tax=Timema podura TaxID=61482 RepID=A0ABN7P1C0_TIMPD|nr:unnamed protein product [Timema podura]